MALDVTEARTPPLESPIDELDDSDSVASMEVDEEHYLEGEVSTSSTKTKSQSRGNWAT